MKQFQQLKILISNRQRFQRSFLSSFHQTNFDLQNILSIYSQKELNLFHLLIQQHSSSPSPTPSPSLSSSPALYFNNVIYSYSDIERESLKLMKLFSSLGIQKGSCIAILLPKCVNLLITAITIWRLGAIYIPLFTAFGPDAIDIRINDSQASIIVTDQNNNYKLNNLRKEKKVHIILTNSNDDQHQQYPEQDHFWIDSSYSHPLYQSQGYFPLSININSTDPIALLYTSGTTGLPKGVIIPAFSLASFHTYMKYGLGLQERIHSSNLISSIQSSTNEITNENQNSHQNKNNQQMYQRYYCTADTGWAYGLYYNLIGPLLLGIPLTYPSIEPFNPLSLLKILSQCNITHFSSSPSAYRSLRAFDLEEIENKKQR